MSKYRYLEGLLADNLGLSQATLRKARKLFMEEGRDFGRIHHESRKRVAYTKEGAGRIIRGMAESPEFGARATQRLNPDDITPALDASIVLEAGLSVDEPATQPCANATNLLNAPWEVPPATLIVVRPTKNKRILEAVLHPDWVRENGFEYYHRILRPILAEHELADPNLFETKLMRVQVKETRKFIRGMEIKAAWVQQDLWECTQRMPRYKGRW